VTFGSVPNLAGVENGERRSTDQTGRVAKAS